MIRPLFQALRFGVVAGSWTPGMICPPILPPYPGISTTLTLGAQHLCIWPLCALRRGKWIFGHAAISALRALAALFEDFRYGLKAAVAPSRLCGAGQ